MIKFTKFCVLVCLLLSVFSCSYKEEIVEGAGVFPWPPPRASAFCKLPWESLRNRNGETYLKDVLTRLEAAMEEAGYRERELCSLKHGFALATRIEQYRNDGSPKPDNQRWKVEFEPLPLSILITNFNAYLKSLFYPEILRFRRIVLIVKPGEVNERKNPLSPTETKKMFSSRIKGGWGEDIMNIPFTHNYTCTALIYEFEKYKINDEPVPLNIGHLDGKTHLEKSNLWNSLVQEKK